jgi:hypothetical protein
VGDLEADADANDRGEVGDCVSGELKAGADAGDEGEVKKSDGEEGETRS